MRTQLKKRGENNYFYLNGRRVRYPGCPERVTNLAVEPQRGKGDGWRREDGVEGSIAVVVVGICR